MTKLEQLRKVIVEAVPEIVELKFGCRITFDGNTSKVIYFVDPKHVHFCDGSRELNIVDNGHILGRPIRLADILLAICHCEKNWTNEEYGCVSAEITYKNVFLELTTNEKGYGKWNMRHDDLSQQSPETIDFLHSLLVTKE